MKHKKSGYLYSRIYVFNPNRMNEFKRFLFRFQRQILHPLPG